jgi:hypothetical protein
MRPPNTLLAISQVGRARASDAVGGVKQLTMNAKLLSATLAALTAMLIAPNWPLLDLDETQYRSS